MKILFQISCCCLKFRITVNILLIANRLFLLRLQEIQVWYE